MEKVLVVCFLFLGDPAQNSGIGASTKFWHVIIRPPKIEDIATINQIEDSSFGRFAP